MSTEQPTADHTEAIAAALQQMAAVRAQIASFGKTGPTSTRSKDDHPWINGFFDGIERFIEKVIDGMAEGLCSRSGGYTELDMLQAKRRVKYPEFYADWDAELIRTVSDAWKMADDPDYIPGIAYYSGMTDEERRAVMAQEAEYDDGEDEDVEAYWAKFFINRKLGINEDDW